MYINKETLVTIDNQTYSMLPDVQPQDEDQCSQVKSDFDILVYDKKPSVNLMEYIVAGDIVKVGDDLVQQWVICSPSKEDIIAMYVRAVRGLLDNTSKVHGYDSISTAVSYAEESAVPKFQSEGRAFRAWRSLVWDCCYSQLSDNAQPEISVFLAAMPSFVLPTTTTV